mgnify:CR=1 FL=1
MTLREQLIADLNELHSKYSKYSGVWKVPNVISALSEGDPNIIPTALASLMQKFEMDLTSYYPSRRSFKTDYGPFPIEATLRQCVDTYTKWKASLSQTSSPRSF